MKTQGKKISHPIGWLINNLEINYFFIVVESLCIVSAGAAIIAAESVAAGAGVVAGAAIVAVVSVAVVSSVELLPQEATKRPIVRAKMLNFTNFMTLNFFSCFSFMPKTGKGNLCFIYFLK
jgi:hypothetical protein